jgi:hypothetical protein
MHTKSRFTIAACAILLALACSTPARAQFDPDVHVRFIVRTVHAEDVISDSLALWTIGPRTVILRCMGIVDSAYKAAAAVRIGISGATLTPPPAELMYWTEISEVPAGTLRGAALSDEGTALSTAGAWYAPQRAAAVMFYHEAPTGDIRGALRIILLIAEF